MHIDPMYVCAETGICACTETGTCACTETGMCACTETGMCARKPARVHAPQCGMGRFILMSFMYRLLPIETYVYVNAYVYVYV